VKAFSDIFEWHLPKVGLHGKNGIALHLGECRAVEGARKLEVGERSGWVLVLVHVAVLVC
jgi:hypothetical protein